MHLFRRFLFAPGTIGTLAPSSTRLANAVLQDIGMGTAIFEIGAGTGAITRHIPCTLLLRPLVLFEQDCELAESLRRNFPYAQVMEGFFHTKIGELADIPEDLALVSSIPFRSLPKRLHFSTVAAICNILTRSPNRRLIQYTYLSRPPFSPRYHDLHWQRLSRVLANFPPATVWELRSRAA